MSFGCTAACVQPTNAQCHCTGCHQTFRHVGDFENHRKGEPEARTCLWPVKLGLANMSGLWATVESHAKAREAGRRLAVSRSSSSSQEATEE
jgi:hypothetical protein